MILFLISLSIDSSETRSRVFWKRAFNYALSTEIVQFKSNNGYAGPWNENQFSHVTGTSIDVAPYALCAFSNGHSSNVVIEYVHIIAIAISLYGIKAARLGFR
jgi:hypothetical protein